MAWIFYMRCNKAQLVAYRRRLAQTDTARCMRKGGEEERLQRSTSNAFDAGRVDRVHPREKAAVIAVGGNRVPAVAVGSTNSVVSNEWRRALFRRQVLACHVSCRFQPVHPCSRALSPQYLQPRV